MWYIIVFEIVEFARDLYNCILNMKNVKLFKDLFLMISLYTNLNRRENLLITKRLGSECYMFTMCNLVFLLYMVWTKISKKFKNQNK